MDLLRELEVSIGTKSGFFKKLLDEDDWSFVVKLHAFFEAVCTHLLLFHFKEPELDNIFSRLELSNKTTGKLAFLDKLELIRKEDRRLISSLSELRNNLVHDVRNSEFSLNDYVSGLTKKNTEILAVTFSPSETIWRKLVKDPILGLTIDPKLIEQADIKSLLKRIKEDPKEFIWFGSLSTLIHLDEMHSYSEYKHWEQAKKIIYEDDAK